jgi:hypothetical protein
MMQRLGIEEDEFDDLVLEEEMEAPKLGLKWMALARVHTPISSARKCLNSI